MNPNPETGIFVSAYAGDKLQVESNLPVYLHHGCPVVILSPANAPITSVSDSRVHCQWFGEAGWAGQQTLMRHKLFLKAMLTFPFKWFLMHDADSVCLSPYLPRYLYEGRVAWSNEVQDTNTGPSHLDKIAVQPPYFFHREVLEALIATAENPPPSYYGEVTGDPIPTNCIDHFHWQLTAGCGFPHRNFPHGASWETTSTVGLEEMARVVRDGGKVMIHQVKTKAVLDRLMSERAARVARLK
jgi:hypothetical protein